jgi:hypothetical protein
MSRIVAIVVGFLLVIGAAILAADEAILEQLYGNGVHAFNDRDYATAYRHLTAAIQGGSHDPRAYYFRGLASLSLGKQQEAGADFQKGAELESGDSAGVYPVGKSIARIQGPTREYLEQYREGARITAHQRQEAAKLARYQERVEAEKTVLRHVAPTQLPPPPGTVSSKSAAPPSAAGGPPPDGDPFAEPKAVPTERPAAKPEAPAKSDDPFGGPATQPTPPPSATGPAPRPSNDADPFGGGATMPKAEAPTVTPTPTPTTPPATNPATPPAAEADPFGGGTMPKADVTPTPTPPAATTPGGATGADADPFGGPAATQPTMPAPTQPTPTPEATTPSPMPGPTEPAPTTSAAEVKPTPGAVGGLFRALSKNTGQAMPASSGPFGSILDAIHIGIQSAPMALPGNQGGPPGPMPTNTPPGATPAPAPVEPMPDGGAQNTDPFGNPAPQPSPAPAMPSAQPAPSPTPPAADPNDPFKAP